VHIVAYNALILLLGNQEWHLASENTAAAVCKGFTETFDRPPANPDEAEKWA